MEGSSGIAARPPSFPQPKHRKADSVPPSSSPQFVRLKAKDRPTVSFHLDDVALVALSGDTLATAILISGRRLRESEFGDGARAGFCLMGACQDCWLWSGEGERLRACSTAVQAGMRIYTNKPVLTA